MTRRPTAPPLPLHVGDVEVSQLSTALCRIKLPLARYNCGLGMVDLNGSQSVNERWSSCLWNNDFVCVCVGVLAIVIVGKAGFQLDANKSDVSQALAVCQCCVTQNHWTDCRTAKASHLGITVLSEACKKSVTELHSAAICSPSSRDSRVFWNCLNVPTPSMVSWNNAAASCNLPCCHRPVAVVTYLKQSDKA